MMAEATKAAFGIDELASQYGYAAAFFNSSPELKALISQAVREQWTPEKFRAKFQNTEWYRSKTAGVRTWLELKNRDPKEAGQRLNNQVEVLRAEANRMGMTVSTGRLREIAEGTLMYGWPQEFITSVLAAEFKYRPGGGTQGQASTIEDLVRRTANDFGITVSDTQVGGWVSGALAGRYTEDHIRDFIRDAARSKYPGLNGYLEQGFSVRQVAEPYLQSYAEILETPAETVQLRDPLVQKALQGIAPPKPGATPQAMTVYEFEKSLRKDPRWRKTKNAREAVTNTALGVLQDMGIYA